MTDALIDLARAIAASPIHSTVVDLLSNVPGLPPMVQTVHLLSIAAVMGSIVLVDLKLLGLALPGQSAAELARRLMPWMWWALPLLALSGLTFLMADLRLLGLAARNHTVSRITREIVPWTWAAFAIALITGLGLFITRAGAYVENRAFQIKLLLLILAGANMVALHFVALRSADRWETTTVTTAPAKVAGACSLLVWAGVMLAGRWVGHLA